MPYPDSIRQITDVALFVGEATRRRAVRSRLPRHAYRDCGDCHARVSHVGLQATHPSGDSTGMTRSVRALASKARSESDELISVPTSQAKEAVHSLRKLMLDEIRGADQDG